MHISQKTAQNIVNEMKLAIHKDINIMDENGVILSSTNPTRLGQLHQGALQVIHENLSALPIEKDDIRRGVQRGVNFPLTINGKLEGVIGITGDPAQVSIFGDVIKRMTEIMLESAQQREKIDLINRAKGMFVENWIFAESPDWAELELRGHMLDIPIEDPYTVALLQIATPEHASEATKTEELSEMRNNMLLRTVHNRLQENPMHFCMVIHNRIIVLMHRTNKTDALAIVGDICGAIENFYHLRMCAGISNASLSSSNIRRCYLEAKTAALVAEQSTSQRIIPYNQVSPEFIAQSIPASIKHDLRKLVFTSCTEREQEEFCQTIRFFFDQSGDIQKCADTLFIHRNTFQYRMDCVRKKTGYSLKVPKDSLLLYLSIQ